MRLHFGDCTIDLNARRLSRGPGFVHLSPKAFDALEVLIARRPAAVSKTELLERVWRDVFVAEGSLTRAVNEIRAAVGDVARQGRVIRTVHSYGYAFVADAREEDADRAPTAVPMPCRYLVSATRTVVVRGGEQVVGRDPLSDICIDSPKVSWRHARILATAAAVTIEDLGSKNGTYVRGTRIDAPTVIESGDELRIGRVRFVCYMEDVHRATETDADFQRADSRRRP